MRILHVENDPASAKSVRQMLREVVEDYETTALGEYAVQLASAKTMTLSSSMSCCRTSMGTR
jgi:hypothetical protein